MKENSKLYLTREEELQIKIMELKTQLKATDYKAIKFAEGELTEEEYAPIKEQRKEWRAEINELESEIISNE